MSLQHIHPQIESFRHLSTSNEAPEDDELVIIRGVLEEPQRELDAMSVQLAQLQTAMRDLQAKKRLLQERMQPLQAMASPVRWLPDDILQEIFLLCLPRDHYPTLDPLHAPLVLTHICRRWRYVAGNTRRLWTEIHIPLPVFHIPSQSIPLVYAQDERYKLKAKFTSMADSFVSTVETWIGRIGGCPLSFSVYQKDHQNREEDVCLQAVLRILLGRSQQWERVDVSAPLRSVGSLVGIQPEDVPLMKSLSVWSTSRHGLSTAGFPYMLGEHTSPRDSLPSWRHSRIFEAPQLDSLSLYRIDEPLALMPIDWSKLRSLVIEKQGTSVDMGYMHRGIVIDIPVVASVLRRCTRLECVRVALTPGAPDPPKNHETLATPIELPYLVSLAFFEDRSCAASLFRILEAPAIRKLEFQTLRKPEPVDINGSPPYSILPFLRRWGGRIEEFVADTQFVVPYDRVACWEMMPGLKRLTLAPSTFGSVMYPGDEQGVLPFTNCDLRQFMLQLQSPTMMGPDVGVVPLLPQLESFECTTLSTVSDRGVLDFVKERKMLGLGRVRLAYERDWDKPVGDLEAELGDARSAMTLILEKKFRPCFIQPRQGLKMRT